MTTTPSPLTPAVRQALAYVAILGNFCKGTHLDTRLAAGHYTKDLDYATCRRFYAVPDAETYAATPLWKAHAALVAVGFSCLGNTRPRNGKLRIEKTIQYEKLDDNLDGFSVTLYPQGHLYMHRVKKGQELYTKEDVGSTSAAEAGTLPPLFTASL